MRFLPTQNCEMPPKVPPDHRRLIARGQTLQDAISGYPNKKARKGEPAGFRGRPSFIAQQGGEARPSGGADVSRHELTIPTGSLMGCNQRRTRPCECPSIYNPALSDLQSACCLNPAILTFDDLREISRLGPNARLSSMERWARGNGIRYKYDGRGGIWTTVAAMNAAVGVTSNTGDDTKLRAEDVSF